MVSAIMKTWRSDRADQEDPARTTGSLGGYVQVPWMAKRWPDEVVELSWKRRLDLWTKRNGEKENLKRTQEERNVVLTSRVYRIDSLKAFYRMIDTNL